MFHKLKKIFNNTNSGPKENKYHSSLFKYLDPERKVVLVDVGAHNGAFVDLIESYCGIKRGLLIEPLDKSFSFLSNKYSDKKDWVLLKNVVGDQEGAAVNFFVNSFEETSSLLRIRSIKELEGVDIAQKEEVASKMRTLDAIWEENDFGEADLLKIDVQGAEHLVLKGGKNTLKKTRMIWIENSFKPLYEGSSVFSDIYEMMVESGFFLAEISPGHRSRRGELLQADALYINGNFAKR